MKFPCQIEISITKTDITRGRPTDSTGCPIARSIRRQLPKGIKAIVDIGAIRLYRKRSPTPWQIIARAIVPNRGRSFILRFDQQTPKKRRAIKPFSLKLDFESPLGE